MPKISSFFQAIKDNNTEFVSEYIKSGILSRIPRENGLTPLQVAIKSHNLEMVKLLLDDEASSKLHLWTREDYTASPLVMAIQENQSGIALELLERGAGVGMCEVSFNPTIHTIRKDNWGNSFSSKLVTQLSPLNEACKYSLVNVVKALISKGAEVNQKVGDFTPLIAVFEECSKYLSPYSMNDYSAEIKKKMLDNKLEIINLLIDHGADVSASFRPEYSYLDFASGQGKYYTGNALEVAGYHGFTAAVELLTNKMQILSTCSSTGEEGFSEVSSGAESGVAASAVYEEHTIDSFNTIREMAGTDFVDGYFGC